MNNLLISHHIHVPGRVPSIANVTVITVINTLSANGSMIVPNNVFILYFLAIWPSNFIITTVRKKVSFSIQPTAY